jgi:hypothetical protein
MLCTAVEENRRMAQPDSDRREWVGPVLQAGAVADAMIAAIKQLNAEAVVVDRGAYRRVLPGGSGSRYAGL